MTDIDRAGAIRICAVAASTPGFFVDYGWSDIPGASAAAWNIAFAAYLNSGGDFAEAEAALRDAPAQEAKP